MNFQAEQIQLLTIDPHTFQFQLTAKGKQFLKKLDRPVSIITIAGLYRTGKSYLVNKLIKRKATINEKGFKVGSTTQSVTKGLNVWGQPIPAETETGQQIYYILVDSEGLGSLQQQIQYDLKLLLLIFLVSSTVVYNSVGAIDESSLDQLRVVLNLNRCLAGVEDIKPRFIWVLRDFSLQLVDKYGIEMTPNQYLNNCLEESNSSTVQSKKKNQIRKAIKENLPRRQCYTLVRPTLKEENLAQLNLNKCKIRPQFVSQIQGLKSSLISGSRSDIKTIKGVHMDGKLLLAMIEQYINKINSGQTPVVQNVWEAVVNINSKERLQEVSQRLKSDVSKIQLPISKQQLQRKLNQIENKAYSVFSNLLRMDPLMMKNHKEFIACTQRVNRSIKDTNTMMLSRNVKSEMMNIVQQNVLYDRVKPSQLTQLKVVLERLNLKAKGSPDAYPYLVEVVYDILYISEQKSLHIERQFDEMKQYLNSTVSQKKQSELTLMAMKHDYHQALKEISDLKNQQIELSKEKTLLKNQVEVIKEQLRNKDIQRQSQDSKYIRDSEYERTKNRSKVDELINNIKKLKQENSELSELIQKLKQQNIEKQHSSYERKQFIFEERMNEAWKKLEQEKVKVRATVSQYQKQIQKVTTKCKELQGQLQFEKQQRMQQQKNHSKREVEFHNEFEELKKSIQQTKKSYQLTYETMAKNDRVLRKIQNLTSTRKDPEQKQNAKFLRNYYQTQLSKEREVYQQQLKELKQQLQKVEQTTKRDKLAYMNTQMEVGQLRDRNRRLQEDMLEANRKFTDCISQIEDAKEKERSLYEESIVRLLTNIDKGSTSHYRSTDPNYY